MGKKKGKGKKQGNGGDGVPEILKIVEHNEREKRRKEKVLANAGSFVRKTEKMPESDVLSRVKAFLPLISASNAQLMKQVHTEEGRKAV